MAHLLAIVSPNPGPLPGQESKALVYMTFSPPEPPETTLPLHAPRGPGYRISVHAAETGRELGRWVSDCSLTVTQSALLWLSMNPWQVEPAQGSLDYMRVMDEVTQHAENPEGAAPRDLVIALSLNFPGSPEVQAPPPGLTGPTGVRLLGGPTRAQSQNPMVRHPQAQAPQFSAPHRGALPQAQISEEPVRQAAPATSHGLDGDELDLAKFLARAIRALKRGADADEVMGAMASLVEPDEDDEIYEEEDGVEIRDPEEEGDYEDDYYDEEERPGAFVGDSEQPRYRPLLPGEIPQGAGPEEIAALEGYASGDGRLREKFERTQSRANEQILHARRVAAANEHARQLAAEQAAVSPVVLSEVPPVVAQQVPAGSLHDPIIEHSPQVEAAPTNGTNGGGPPRMTKARLVEAITSQDPTMDAKSLMKLKRDELVDHLEHMA